MGLLGPFKSHEDAPWRGLSVCCAETRLGVGPDIDTIVDAARKSARDTRRLQQSVTPLLLGSG